jgi:hypothetical protein
MCREFDLAAWQRYGEQGNGTSHRAAPFLNVTQGIKRDPDRAQLCLAALVELGRIGRWRRGWGSAGGRGLRRARAPLRRGRLRGAGGWPEGAAGLDLGDLRRGGFGLGLGLT